MVIHFLKLSLGILVSEALSGKVPSVMISLIVLRSSATSSLTE